MKKSKEKMPSLTKPKTKVFVLSLLFAIIGIAFVVIVLKSKDWFNYDLLSSDESSLESFKEWFINNRPIMIRSLLVIIISLLAIFFIKLIQKLIGTKSKKIATFISILFSIIKWAIIIIAIMRILLFWGVDILAIVAGLGIVALVIGLGCQSLISDIVAGIFLVIDNAYEVGDIVVIDGFRGKVSEIGLKSTKIVDAGGNVKLIQNSDITTVVNLTHSYSVAINIVSIGYNENVKKVEDLISTHMDEIKKGVDGIISGPFYKGVEEVGDSSIDLKFITTCKEEDRFQVERDLNRNFLILFNENNITIPFTQITINDKDPDHKKVTKEKSKKKDEK